MTNRIDPDVIEAAAKAIHIVRFGKAFPWDSETGAAQAERIHCRTMAEAAIRAADGARGLRAQRSTRRTDGSGKIYRADGHFVSVERLTSDWRLVERDEQNIDKKERR